MKNILKKILGVFMFVVSLFIIGSVSATEMSDEFKSYLNKDGKYEFNSNIPANDDHFALLVDLNTYDENGVWNGLSISSAADDYSEINLTINTDEAAEETHKVKVNYNYDKKADTKIKNFVNTVIKNKTVFEVKDLELVNYYYNRIKNGYNAKLTMYSGELKDALNYGNLEFDVSVRGGGASPLKRETIGFGYFSYAGSIYHVINPFGTTADHIIYVPTETENTKEAIMKATQKRIDDYLGETDVEVSYLSTAWEYWVKYHYEDTKEMWEEYEGINFTIEEFEQIIGAYVFTYPSFEEGFEEIFGLAGVSEDDWIYTIDIPIDENMGDSFDVIIRRDSSKMVNPTIRTADLSTEIEISTDKTIPLDTIIQAKQLTSGNEYDRIIKLLNVDDNLVFDLKLYSGSLGEYVTQLSDGTFEVRIPIPENFKNRELKVYYVGSSGKPEQFKVEVKDGYAVFNTNHFSIYTLTAEVSSSNEKVPNTFDGIGSMFMIGLISLIGLVITIIYFKKKNKKRAN